MIAWTLLYSLYLFLTGSGIQWSNFDQPASVDDNLSLLDAMLMLLVDSAIHLLITWYVDNVWPGEFGVPKPWYFAFTVSTDRCMSTSSTASSV